MFKSLFSRRTYANELLYLLAIYVSDISHTCKYSKSHLLFLSCYHSNVSMARSVHLTESLVLAWQDQCVT